MSSSTRSRYHRAWLAPLALAAVSTVAAACGSGGSGTVPSGAGSPTTAAPPASADGTSTSVAAPSSTATTTLAAPLDEAYRAETGALATYRHVVTRLGPVGPFPNVVQAEEQHVSTVGALFTRYGLGVPTAATGQASPATRSAACTLGASIEREMVAMYDRLLPSVTSYPAVTTVFHNLQAVSRDNHLPAFEHCS